MGKVQQRNQNRRHREQGVTMLYVAIAMVGLLGFASLTVDIGIAFTAKTQAQAAVDAIALGAAANMIDVDGAAAVVTQSDSELAGITVASENHAFPNPSLSISANDLTFGNWDFDTRTLDDSVDLNNPDQVTAVTASLQLNGVQNQSVPAVLSRVLGRTSFNVGCTATAYLGFAGDLGPGEVDLPIAIPCCLIGGCEGGYCGGDVAPVVNQCPLETAQARADSTVSCIQFSNTADQTGCWTQFDGMSPSVNTNQLTSIVNNGNGDSVEADENIYLDNGEKTPVMKDIYDRFYGEGLFQDNPAGSDTDGDEIIDSWLIQLPVVTCQDSDHCAKGEPAPVKGFVCAEVREVIVSGNNKTIRLNFVCPQSDPTRYAKCLQNGASTTGGEDFGIRATIPVLVK